MPRETNILDYLAFLQDLDKAEECYFLEGGQAVNFWAEYYTANAKTKGLQKFIPFTSKDCDVWIGIGAMRYLQSKASGRLLKGKSPADGQIGIFTTGGDSPRTIDLMSGVYGINPGEMDVLRQRAHRFNGITVLDPLNLFRSKCHCLIDLDQTDRQDEKHLRMLCLILHAHLSNLIGTAKVGEITERQLIREIKLLRKFCSLNRCRRALKLIETTPESLFPIRKMIESRLDRLSAFAASTWPDHA
jgi:hypothetical protein